MHNSDVGFERHSPRDERFMKFVADGPGVAGFRFEVDPEVDHDAFAASFDSFRRPKNTETCFTFWDNRRRELALEAIAAESGFEPTAPDLDMDDDSDEEEDEESSIVGLDPKYLVERSEGAIGVFRDGEFREVQPRRERRNGELYREVILKPQLEAMRLVSRALQQAETQRVRKERELKPTTPPVGKFLTGTVTEQFPGRGLHVEVEGIGHVRVPIALERGHGSWGAAASWILGFEPGDRVRIKVVRVLVNGHAIIEAILADRHPRPWQRRQQQMQTEAPAAN